MFISVLTALFTKWLAYQKPKKYETRKEERKFDPWTRDESSIEGDPEMVQMLELEDKDLKITVKSMLKDVVEKVDNM